MKIFSENINVMEMINNLCAGHPKAANVIMLMLDDPASFRDIMLLDSYDIRGERLYKLFYECCNKDKKKFELTILLIRNGIFPKDLVLDNLNAPNSIPFIDDNITINNIFYYDEILGCTDEIWLDYCIMQKNSFLAKMNSQQSTSYNNF